MKRGENDTGSILLLALFACLGAALLALGLAVSVAGTQRALDVEEAGRETWAQGTHALARLGSAAIAQWAPGVVRFGGTQATSAEGDLAATEPASDLILAGTVHVPALESPTGAEETRDGVMSLSAWIERGRDGLDLPLAAVVAASMSAAEARMLEWVSSSPSGEMDAGSADTRAVIALAVEPENPIWGAGCVRATLYSPWHLDEGSLALSREVAGTVAAPDIVMLDARPGQIARLPSGSYGASEAAPVLVVAVEGGMLDLSGLGDVYGVVVGGRGVVRLEGTTLRGAVLTEGDVQLGTQGRVVFGRDVLRWATDRCLTRVRLVPYSRTEVPSGAG
jgi:hypothetical protein